MAEFSLLCRRKPVVPGIWKYTFTELEVYFYGAGSILLRKSGYWLRISGQWGEDFKSIY
jgi:hypothetical protein